MDITVKSKTKKNKSNKLKKIQQVNETNEISDINDINDINKINKINEIINNQYDDDIAQQLSDNHLLEEYLNLKSVNNSINELTQILRESKISDDIIDEIKNKYILKLIPPGTKGIIRGIRFNKIVKEYIINLKLDNIVFDIQFETKCLDIKTSEIPDWYIKNKQNNKIIIGMNQLSLVGGGQQINRGSKYILETKLNTHNTKLLCVVCNKIKINSTTNKQYEIYKKGFDDNTLCYINNLSVIINDFFND